jgi:hypothetical protein
MTRWPSISADVTIASAFVARCCSAQRREIVNGVYRLRDDEPTRRISADQGDFDEARSEAPGKSGSGARVRCPDIFGHKWDQIRNRS